MRFDVLTASHEQIMAILGEPGGESGPPLLRNKRETGMSNYDYYREQYEQLLKDYEALRNDYRLLYEEIAEEIAALKQENYELRKKIK